jgi:fumarylpyruvate hydrolase
MGLDYLFPPLPPVSLPILGGKHFPVRRIYCVGRNYADHAREMGSDPERELPFFFSKPVDTLLPNHGVMPYPPGTSDLHHEVEMVVALASGGAGLSLVAADDCIFGYAVGLDMTRRDLQAAAKKKGQPWDMAKGFDHAAPCSAITPRSRCGTLERGPIRLLVNGTLRQQGDLGDMIWSVPEIISHLSHLVELRAGDLVFTGTPAGVATVARDDVLEASVAGLETLSIRVSS